MSADEKATLRSVLRQRRITLYGTRAHSSASNDACKHIAQALAVLPKTSVAAYWAVQSELTLSPLLKSSLSLQFCLPKVQNGTRVLSFKRFKGIEDLIDGPHGTKHPAETTKNIEPDIVLVPLLGFDRQGRRIGQGGGYYDATLAALRGANPDIMAIGIGFSCQEVPHIPTEPHDATLDAIATETGIHYV